MIKIIVLVMLILLAVDGIFRDGYLIEVFLGQEMYLPFFTKVAFLIIAIVASALLFHAIVWEFSMQPKLEERKTELQLKREEEEEAKRKEEEEETEKLRKEEAELAKRKKEEDEIVSNEGRKYLL